MSTLKVGTIQDHANSTTAMTIDDSGRVFRPVLPAWRLMLNANQTMTSNSAIVNFVSSGTATEGCFIQGGCSLSSGVITVPVAGVYQVNATVRYQNVGGIYVELYMRINASAHRGYHLEGDPYDTYHSISTSHTFKLAANDTIDITANAVNDTDWYVSANRLSSFSGFMVG